MNKDEIEILRSPQHTHTQTILGKTKKINVLGIKLKTLKQMRSLFII